MTSDGGYKIVRLASGVNSVHSLAERETFHPVIGPVAEAEALYVRQLRLRERLAAHCGEFVVWDVGLGAAANALTVLRHTRDLPVGMRLESFDHTLAPLEFALNHAAELGYFGGYEAAVKQLLAASPNEQHALAHTEFPLTRPPGILSPSEGERAGVRGLLDSVNPASFENGIAPHQSSFTDGQRAVNWRVHVADFPSLLARPEAGALPKPHAILFDAFSPAKNPAMWTLPLFTRIFQLLDPARPCAMPTYSRSTLLRVTLLLAGFYVGVGHATGDKEETTIAANARGLIAEPLDREWLNRARRSTSAEPLHEASYRQAKLSGESWARLQRHPQFE